jgi:hypothetical protein
VFNGGDRRESHGDAERDRKCQKHEPSGHNALQILNWEFGITAHSEPGVNPAKSSSGPMQYADGYDPHPQRELESRHLDPQGSDNLRAVSPAAEY